MRNSAIVGLVLLLMACSNIVHLHKGTTDDELTTKPLASPVETPLNLEEIANISPDEMVGPTQIADFSPSDKTPEGRGGEEQELIVGIPGPPLDDEIRAFSEPDLPPMEQWECRPLWTKH